MQFDRRWRVSLTALALAALAAVGTSVWLVRAAEPSLSLTRLQAVGAGMTRAQVREAVGVAPGDYPPGRLFYFVGVRCGHEAWRCPEGELHVWYDAGDRVADAAVYVRGVLPPDRFQARFRGGK